jgi:hypothetical protein
LDPFQRSAHDLLGGTLEGIEIPRVDSFPNKQLADWIDSNKTFPIGLDGPLIQESGYDESTQYYIESTLRKERENNNNNNKGTLNDEQIHQLVKDSNIKSEAKKQLEQLLREYRTQLSLGFSDSQPAGSFFFIPHKIKLTHNNPIWTPQFRRSHKEEEILNKQVLDMFQQGVIEKSASSEYNSPAMVVPKKDGTWRTVIDYRNINKDTIKEFWPITRVEEAIDALHKAKYITKIDCTAGYWQIPLEQEIDCFHNQGWKMAIQIIANGHNKRSSNFPKEHGNNVDWIVVEELYCIH